MGYGRVGKHRKHPSGRGNAGGFHHMRTHFKKFHPGYFGKKGQRHLHLKRNQYFCPSINVDKLWTLVSGQTYEMAKERAKEGEKAKAVVIDCTKAGFFKVLGKGELPKIPVIVKAKLFSKIAEKRIKAVGGACVLTA
eukprot:TRINITY_DN0_c2066_g1_i5.p3 TRINITY_DN0_c2066_g1~~TRINITY_DN0_c2066_g1_i5.p3  ORF type:complete len:137 (-),score=50.30 TRINITY_DN0_c2066_g1_i5:92-502(-)